ncbi:MAG: type VI secretion protein [Ruminococcus sp.]|nr:type VI secretion protein [Ruminococcus sp.]
MDKETLNKRISAGNFVENNGSVLRTINILKTKFNRLKDIKYALNIEKNDIENSINYLYEAGYLHLRHVESKQPSSLADTDFDVLESKLTAKGIQLLAGVIQDECVEI